MLDELFNLRGKCVVVTGATGQLGRTLVRAYHAAGARVVGLDRDVGHHRLDGVEYLALDIVQAQEVRDTFASICRTFGTIDVLVNNAGVSTFELFEERTGEQFDWVMDVNLKGTFFGIQEYVRSFDRHHWQRGAIVSIASLYGLVSPDFRIYTDCARKNSEVYGATKAGVIQMTKYFGVHLADRQIRVNAVSPGGIFNPENPQSADFVKNYSYRCPMKRMAEDREIVGAVLYLSSDAASYVTGHNLLVDGGFSCW